MRSVYDPPVTTQSPGSVEDQSKNSSSMLSPFDEQEEWAKISDLITNLGSGNAKESMCNELEKEFQARLGTVKNNFFFLVMSSIPAYRILFYRIE